jgi:hypothetical protein
MSCYWWYQINGIVQYLKVEHLICFKKIRALAGFVSW